MVRTHRRQSRTRTRPRVLALLFVFLITVVPLLMMIYASLLPFYPAPSRAAFESMSLANYTSLLSASNTITPMTNFWIIGVFTATIVSLLLVFAAMGKSAQVPFSGWLPQAMEGPTPSSAIFYGALSIHAGATCSCGARRCWNRHRWPGRH